MININYDPLRRSTRAVGNAKLSRFFAEDIDLSRQSLELNQRQLGLNEELLNFNKKMQRVNNIMQGAQLAVSFTSASINLGQAIYNNIELKQQRLVQNEMNQRDATIEYAVANGFVPYELDEHGNVKKDENGKAIKIGFGSAAGEDGRTVAEIDDEIKRIVAGKGGFSSNWAQERFLKKLEDSYMSQELKAQKMIAVREQKVRDALEFESMSKLESNIIRDGLSVDGVPLEFGTEEYKAALENAVRDELIQNKNKSPGQLKLATDKWVEQITAGSVRQKAGELAQTQGFAAAEKYIKEARAAGLISDDAKVKEILSYADQEHSVSMKAFDDEIKNIMKQNEEARMPILSSYNSLMNFAKEQQDPQKRAKAEEAAQKKQHAALTDRFGNDLGGINRMSLRELNDWFNIYKNRERDYVGQGMLHKQHLDAIYREIENRQNAGGGRSSSSKEDNYDEARRIVEMWQTGETKDGKLSMAGVISCNLPPKQQEDLLKMLFAPRGLVVSEIAYPKLESFLKPIEKDDPSQKEWANAIRMELGELIFRGQVTDDNVMKLVEDRINRHSAEFIGRAGNIRDIKLVRKMAKNDMFEGDHFSATDIYGTTRMVQVPGTKEFQDQFMARDNQDVQTAIRATDWNIEQSKFEEINGDKTGQNHFILVNSSGEKATVRVEEDGKLYKMVDENRNKWESFEEDLQSGTTRGNINFEESLTANVRGQIDAAMTRVPRDYRGNPESFIRERITAALGNAASTHQGRAFIDAKIQEYRNRRR